MFKGFSLDQGEESGMSTKPVPQTEGQSNPWAKYEQRKAELPEDLSAEEYQTECKRIGQDNCY